MMCQGERGPWKMNHISRETSSNVGKIKSCPGPEPLLCCISLCYNQCYLLNLVHSFVHPIVVRTPESHSHPLLEKLKNSEESQKETNANHP
jgi:hypothetical protein